MVAIIASITALFLAAINYRATQRHNRSSKNIEIRTQAYIDFINLVAEFSQIAKEDRKPTKDMLTRLADAKSRISIYGKSTVIIKLAEFFSKHGALNSDEAFKAFEEVVKAMRIDAIGSVKDETMESISVLLFKS